MGIKMDNSLVGNLWPQTKTNVLSQIVLLVFGVALLTAAAKVKVEFWPVPMTMQTLAVLLIGATYGFRLALVTVASYLVLGALGAPVFARGGGFLYFAGSTGGYLISYLVAAGVMGWLSERGMGRTLLTAIPLLLIGEAVIFAIGIGWLAWFLAFLPEKALWVKSSALYDGFIVFIPAEILKMALATAILGVGWRQARRQ
jgi:biotin transport system substrate-specific component